MAAALAPIFSLQSFLLFSLLVIISQSIAPTRTVSASLHQYNKYNGPPRDQEHIRWDPGVPKAAQRFGPRRSPGRNDDEEGCVCESRLCKTLLAAGHETSIR